jgi:hypothetical protein
MERLLSPMGRRYQNHLRLKRLGKGVQQASTTSQAYASSTNDQTDASCCDSDRHFKTDDIVNSCFDAYRQSIDSCSDSGRQNHWKHDCGRTQSTARKNGAASGTVLYIRTIRRDRFQSPRTGQ